MERLQKACEALRKHDIAACIVTSHENIAYVTDFDMPLPIGSGVDFALGLPLAFAILETGTQKVHMVLQAGLVSGIAPQPGLQLHSYSSFDHWRFIDPAVDLHTAMDAALSNIPSPAQWGMEPHTLPLVIWEHIRQAWPNATCVDAYPALFSARATKTPAELSALRKSSLAVDAAQKALNDCAQAYGMNEFEIWVKCVDAASRVCGAPAVVSGELVTGDRCAVVNYPGGPKDYVVQKGDMGIMDFSVRLNGYWCDCCNTVVFGGKPSPYQQKYPDVTKAAFEASVKAMRPGVRCCDIYKAAETAYARYGESVPHYIGHQIGATVNEGPRIVPYDETVLEEGMVFSLEPGCYEGPGGRFGSRNEKMVYLWADGCEVLNQFAWGC